MQILSASFSSAATIFRCSMLTGEPVLFPTDTIYGLGAPLASIAANKKIFAIKNRPKGQPLPVLAGSIEQVCQLTGLKEIPQLEGCTMILPASQAVDKFYTKDNTIAIRLVHGWLGAALELIGPVTATSVNQSGSTPLLEADVIAKHFAKRCKYMLWGSAASVASKIIDCTGDRPRVIRGLA